MMIGYKQLTFQCIMLLLVGKFVIKIVLFHGGW